ncbi:putative signal transducing protein [Aquicella lusitana]|uniref:Putative signal transducing protein n=1 Tax=Aquicella lusitana TaxID=254246 RepID=A0A370GI97_9COXI|nr:DUF2007 domain-containing protein [Aquicella lusitana]RDI43377.1 putative signal transducing protein [Aquicella lusitana]VVC73527.1 hypothetical protein AQULUS_12700 [Aquicella lusitana]
MKKVFTSSNITLVSFYKTLLEDNGIAVIVKNYYLTGGVGDIPPNECVPELWVIDDDLLDEAMAILSTQKQTPWVCACGEKHGGQFVQCWKCGKIRKK